MVMPATYFCVKNRSKLLMTFVVSLSLCFIYYGLAYNEVHRIWVQSQRRRLYTGGEELNSEGLAEATSEQCVEYVGQHPACAQTEGSAGRELPSCSALRKSPAKEDLKVMLEAISEEELEAIHGDDLEPGGLYRPKDCIPSQRVAIIVPFRDRDLHLKVFLNHIHPFLKKQKIQYMIIVVEQAKGSVMNRGMLRNIGFVEGEKICNFDCYFFHDVDMIPLREENNYTCGDRPRHHASCLARFKFRLPYKLLFGGVVSFKKDLFRQTNGYPNLCFGWGAEDDILAFRVVKYQNMTIERYPMKASKYEDLRHKKDKVRPSRMIQYHTWRQRAETDGLNSLKYEKYLVEFRKLYTWIYVGINKTDVLKHFPDALNGTN